MNTVRILHVEYVERRTKYGILFIFSLFCEYSYFEYVRINAICRVNQAEYIFRIRIVAPQEYVNIYSTRRTNPDRLDANVVHVKGAAYAASGAWRA